jgi:hypothetical protein
MPVVIPFLAFRLMVGMGLIMLAVSSPDGDPMPISGLRSVDFVEVTLRSSTFSNGRSS